jgi:hypothetical protein
VSHTAKILGIVVNDLDCLGKAAADLGLELVRDQKTYRTYSTQKCDHAIKMTGHSDAYEIGVVKSKDGYDLMQDTFMGGRGMVAAVGGMDCNSLKQSYAAQVALAHYQNEGWNVTQHKMEDGRIILRAMN